MKCLIINARNPLGPVSEIQPLDVRKARLLPFFLNRSKKGGTQEAQERERNLAPLVLLVFRSFPPKNFPRQIIIIKVYSVRNSPQGERL